MNTLKAKKFIVGFIVSALSICTIDGFLYLISDGSFHIKISGSIIGGAIIGGIINTKNNHSIKS